MTIDQPNPVDIHVGLRLRAMRKERHISQSALAACVYVSFQQVQKYERGSNRVSASMLWACAAALDCEIADFFEGLGKPQRDPNVLPSQATMRSRAIMAVAGGPELVDAYLDMQPPMRRSFVNMARVSVGAGA